MKLIINADDFGLCKGVNYGIIEAIKNGGVSSTTLIVNGEETLHAVELMKLYPEIEVGIHLTLTTFKPLTNCKKLVNENGYFRKYSDYKNGEVIDSEELYIEWKAQIEKYIELVGKLPNHIDSHHHMHMNSFANPVAITLAKEYNLQLRDCSTNFKKVPAIYDFFDDNVKLEFFQNIKNRDGEVFEMMAHPAFVDDRLLKLSSYSLNRVEEYRLLTSKEVKEIFEKDGIQLTSYTKLIK